MARKGGLGLQGTGMDERLSAVIEAIYAGSGQAKAWDGILGEMADITGAISGCIVAADARAPRSSVNCFHNIDSAWIKAYNEHFYRYDPSVTRMRHRPGQVLEDHVTGPRPQRIQGGRRVFYHEVMAPQTFRHTLALGLSRERDWDAGIILQRSANKGPFSTEAVTTLGQLGGHLRRGLQIHARLAQVGGIQAGMAAALDKAPMGVLFLDHQGRTAFINRRARDILGETRVLSVAKQGLQAAHSDDNRSLQQLVRDALSAARGEDSGSRAGFWLRDPDWQPALHVAVSPINLAESDDPFASLNSFAAVWLTPRHTERAPSPSALSRLYGITPAEGDLLARLVQGGSPADIARDRAVTLETVRSQLKSLMTKLGVSRQADLVRLVLSGPGMMADHT